MPSHLRLPTLALSILSVALCLAIVGTAARSLAVFHDQQTSNAWLLPVWPNHFDVRELETLIGAAAAIAVLDGMVVVAVLVPSLPVNGIVLLSTLLSTIAAVIAIAFPAVLSRYAPARDTLQSWTCRWSATDILQGAAAPDQFQGLCSKTRFAFYTTIPVCALQLLLFSTALYALFAQRPGRAHHLRQPGGPGAEKGHPLRAVTGAGTPARRHVSFETESPADYQDGARMLGAKS